MQNFVILYIIINLTAMIDYFLTKKESMGVYLPSFCDNFCFL